MKVQFTEIAVVIALGLALCFAQEAPERLAVYAYGASDAGINKSMSSKLLAAMVQSGTYMEIGDPVSFQNELAKNNKSDLASIIQVAKQYGADYVCAVNITEVFGTHSIVARLLKIADTQIDKTSLIDHSLKSLEDLTVASNELANQLLSHFAAPPLRVAEAALLPPPQPQSPPPPQPLAPSLADVLTIPIVVQKQCVKKYNVNELLFKIKEGFPNKLKDCSETLSKDMLTPAVLGGKKLEPKFFMTQCSIEGIKKELPEGFPNMDKILGNLTNSVQGLLNSASVGGELDSKKLVSAVAGMNMGELLSEVKTLSTDGCVIDEPYALPITSISMEMSPNPEKKSDSGAENVNSPVSFGIRAGLNLSHTYAEYHKINNYGSGKGDYGDIFGMQFGFVLDIAASNWFHIQPGFIYIQKGRKEKDYISANYFEFPFLLSLKSSIIPIRLNAGPYMGLCLSSKADIFDDGFDFGLNAGFGFDIDMFYIGVFYDYGFANMSNKSGYDFYNRTIGFNFGVNL